MTLDESQNLTQIKPRTDLGTDSGVRLVCKLVKSTTKTSSNVHESKTYDKAIDNPIYTNRWCEAIKKELSNLDSY